MNARIAKEKYIMKQYRITVNGKSYDVTVEELSGVRQSTGSGFGAAPASYSTNPANIQSVANAASSASVATASGQGSSNTANAAPANNGSVLTVKAPMPGTVIAFKVIVGQKVKRGDVLLLLEAMKMENEIVAPQDGTVVALRVPASAAVNTGDPLVDLA